MATALLLFAAVIDVGREHLLQRSIAMLAPVAPFERFERESPARSFRERRRHVDRSLNRALKWVLPTVRLDTSERANERLAVLPGIQVARQIPSQRAGMLRAFAAVELRAESVPQKPAFQATHIGVEGCLLPRVVADRDMDMPDTASLLLRDVPKCHGQLTTTETPGRVLTSRILERP